MREAPGVAPTQRGGLTRSGLRHIFGEPTRRQPMPQAAPRPCTQPRCGALVRSGSRCPQHRREEQRAYTAARGTSHERGYTARWARYSRRYRKQHPLCVHCREAGRITASAHVDHIVPVDGPDDPGFWERGNHQALCVACHNRKTAKERVTAC